MFLEWIVANVFLKFKKLGVFMLLIYFYTIGNMFQNQYRTVW